MMYLVGKIVATHGIKGEVKVKSESDFHRFNIGNIVYIEKDNEKIPININSHRVHKNLDLITFNDIKDINLVLTYVGCNIYTPHNREELNEGEYYIEDLVGLKAISTEGITIGIVHDMREVPQGYILEVKTNEKIVLIPFVDEFIKEIKKDEIIIELIEGLI